MLRSDKAASPTLSRAPVCIDDLLLHPGSDARRHLTALQHKTFFSAGERLFPLRESRRGVFILIKGRAQLISEAGTHFRRFVRFAKAHEILGLSESIENLPYLVNVETITPCVFEYIRRDDFLRYLVNEPDVCYRLLKVLGLSVHRKTTDFRRIAGI